MTKNTNIGLNQSIETQDYIGFYNRMAAEFGANSDSGKVAILAMQPKTKMQSIIHKKIISLLVKATNVASLRTKASVLITNIIGSSSLEICFVYGRIFIVDPLSKDNLIRVNEDGSIQIWGDISGSRWNDTLMQRCRYQTIVSTPSYLKDLKKYFNDNGDHHPF